MMLRHGHREGLGEQLPGLYSVHLDRQRENPQIDLAELQLLQHRRGLVLVEAQLQARQRFANGLRHPRQQVGPDRRKESDSQGARERVSVGTGECHHLIAGFENPARPRHDLLAGIGEGDMARLTLDELHSEVLLELLQLRRQGRLADEAALRRPPEMPGVRHRHQVAQILQLDVRQRACLAIYGLYRDYKVN